MALIGMGIGRTSGWPLEMPRFDGLIAQAEFAPPAGEKFSVDRGNTNLAYWIESLARLSVAVDRHGSPDLLGQLHAAATLRRSAADESGSARKTADSDAVDTVICCALDSDISPRFSAALMARFAEDIVTGVALLARLLDARGIVVVDATTPANWLLPFKSAIAAHDQLRLIPLRNDYPQDDPVLLVYTLLNRRLRPRTLPTEVGCLVLDAAAAMAVGRAVKGVAMTDVPVAMHDDRTDDVQYAMVPAGMLLTEMFGALSLDMRGAMVRAGSALRDVRVGLDECPGNGARVGPGELVFHATGAEADMPSRACIRCGWCLDICPTRLNPAAVLDAAQMGSVGAAEAAGARSCIECGLCAQVCPSQLPLLDAVRVMIAESINAAAVNGIAR